MTKKMDSMKYFEMAHTASIFSDMVDQHLNPAQYPDAKLQKKLLRASTLLAEVYQEAMNKSFGEK